MSSNNLFNVHLKNHRRDFECAEMDPILESGLHHGLAMRYECSNGSCGSCVAKLLKGQIKQIKHHDFPLTDEQKAENTFLTCCNAPASDLEVTLELIGGVKSIPIQSIEVKVKDIKFINKGMSIVKLRTPRSKTLQFMAGQNVELSFNGKSYHYPIASCPCHGMDLEFHIRHTECDVFASEIFKGGLKAKSKVKLKGPKGIFILKERSKRPMVFIAWDSGFAPIRSLVEHAFSLEMPNPVYFYWAFPATEQIPYLNNHAQSWRAMMDEYNYTPIACTFNRANKNDCKKVAKQIFEALDHNIVNQSDVYISVPAEVLIYLGELLFENGLNETQLIASPI
ncbi:2Fe-2S iron-sulfur cluster-binding protein [Bathymodiolus septemdierum thioautotrophic gill symbiont]|uniref:CDP-4-dehydro-6-deoxyglucose reductase n=1 Tax=endosymbiont of Bathymodiolus septemdierum str. Myojin knoll TaxID=1303921 RepID=A0A0P0US98_9GAMM|nr:2Fe-2S iron-sulfur cluster-binding protein [Bathymodiolus septemdierum thioautotrophic gill symbiont]BAS67862.1 CDP-4-dehydro-6-deoxyglucose reductase [endosymbiont of Bathymodiolus septemdierum str. Myojin knoll]